MKRFLEVAPIEEIAIEKGNKSGRWKWRMITMCEKLKLCPFCGSPAVMRDWAAVGEYWVECTECEMRTAEHYDPKIAALVWNRRAEVKDDGATS